MNQYIFLCDKKWQIRQVLYTPSECVIQPDVHLTDLIVHPEILTQNEDFDAQKQNTVSLLFLSSEREIPAIICTYPQYYLIFLVRVENHQDFADFANSYIKFISWADDHLQAPYQDEYFQIQQMNNQLINSQRALMKTNQRLKQVLDKVRQANDTIAILERDELTEFYRAFAFYQKVQDVLDQSENQEFDIIILDISRFKLINETFGRKAGDTLLQNLALFLVGLENAEKGIFARASADTFFLFMPEELHYYIYLSEQVSAFFKNYPLPIHVQEKIGVYKVNKNTGISVEQMCDRACLALDTQVFQNDSGIAFYDQKLHDALLMEHQLLDCVPEALRKHQFRLYLQPKFDMVTGEVTGAEALIRWVHPEMGLIPPDRFIPLLEKEGGIYEVDRYIWEEACKILHQRQKNGQKKLPISVNVARSDLYQTNLLPVVLSLLEKYELSAPDLHLEILERAYVNDSKHIFEILTSLREHGLFIEMDDFGTGESSLSMVAEMPIDLLKLDRQFLVSSIKNTRQIEVIRFIINLAKTLDVNVIAEGVETKEQAELLCSMGCRYAQGYYYGRPEPAEKFLDVP